MSEFIEENETPVSKEVEVNLQELAEILEKNKKNALSSIPPEKIYMFQIFQGKKLQKAYENKNYSHKVVVKEVQKLWKTVSKLLKPGEDASEIFIRYESCWFGAVQMYGYTIIMSVSDSVDIDHFKTQLMTIFESFTYF